MLTCVIWTFDWSSFGSILISCDKNEIYFWIIFDKLERGRVHKSVMTDLALPLILKKTDIIVKKLDIIVKKLFLK